MDTGSERKGYDAMSGDELDGGLAREALRVEMDIFKKHGVA